MGQMTGREIVFCVVMVVILLALLLSGCASICEDGVMFGYDPSNPNAMCAYDRAGKAIACGLTPEQVVRACKE